MCFASNSRDVIIFVTCRDSLFKTRDVFHAVVFWLPDSFCSPCPCYATTDPVTGVHRIVFLSRECSDTMYKRTAGFPNPRDQESKAQRRSSPPKTHQQPFPHQIRTLQQKLQTFCPTFHILLKNPCRIQHGPIQSGSPNNKLQHMLYNKHPSTAALNFVGSWHELFRGRICFLKHEAFCICMKFQV